MARALSTFLYLTTIQDFRCTLVPILLQFELATMAHRERVWDATYDSEEVDQNNPASRENGQQVSSPLSRIRLRDTSRGLITILANTS